MKKTNEKKVIQWIIGAVLAIALLSSFGIAAYFQFNTPQEIPDDAWFEEIFALRTEQTADMQKLNAIVDKLPISKKMRLQEEPELNTQEDNRLYLTYRISGSTSDFADQLKNKNMLDRCAITLLTLVGDLDRVSITLVSNNEDTAISYDRAWANTNMDEDVWASAANPQKLRTFFVRMGDLNNIAFKDSANS